MPLFFILSWRSAKEIKINKNNERVIQHSRFGSVGGRGQNNVYHAHKPGPPKLLFFSIAVAKLMLKKDALSLDNKVFIIIS